MSDELCNREILPWPNEEGFWWMTSDVLHTICYARKIDDELFKRDLLRDASAKMGDVVITIAGLHGLSDGYCTRNELDDEFGYGPARFAKLVEPNPFERKA